MPVVEFVGQSARDPDNIAANPSRLVNLYREPTVPGGRTGYALKPVMGSQAFATVEGVFFRSIAAVDTRLFAAIGGALYEFDQFGFATDRGTVLDGDTTIAGNNGKVAIAAGGAYYVLDGGTLSSPTPGAFSDFGALDYIGNYTVITERNGRRFQWSALADAADLPGLSFSTADGRDDNLIRPVAINGALWLFKDRSHEVWYVTGGAGAEAFERAAGGVYDVGLRGHDLITRFDGGALFVGDDGRVYMCGGQSLQPVSIPPVETAIRLGLPRSCLTYEDEGHTFCCVVFRDRPAWCYDIATGEWHERSETGGPWKANVSTFWRNQWRVGADGGTLRTLAHVATDAGLPLVKQATSRPVYVDGDRFVMRDLELFVRRGFSDGLIEIETSRDGGLTFGPPKPREFGPVGDYGGRVIWRNLGQFRQAVVRITVTGDITVNADGRVRL